jgi:hypothetical protein
MYTDLTRPHTFSTYLHAARTALPAASRPVTVRFTAPTDVDRDARLTLETWHSSPALGMRGVFESSMEVHRATALVSASEIRYDDGRVRTLAPWDGHACLLVCLPCRTTGTLHLRCVATPLERTAFRLTLWCDKWRHEVAIRASLFH